MILAGRHPWDANVAVTLSHVIVVKVRIMTEHELKHWSSSLHIIASRQKKHDVRKNDRCFRVGDTVKYRVYNLINEEYTGKALRAKITHVEGGGMSLSGLDPSYCILSIEPIGGIFDE